VTTVAIDPKPLVTVRGPTPGPEGESPLNLGAGAEPSVSRYTFGRTPGRLLAFLRGVGSSIDIQTQLAPRGYTPAEHARGWALLRASGGEIMSAPACVNDGAVQKAMKEVEAWDEDGLRIVNASLRNRHPEQHAYVMRGLKASKDVQSVLAVSVLLDRLDALEGAPGREGTRDADHAALATLSARGIDKAERARLRALVEQAQGQTCSDGFEQQGELDRQVRAALVEQRRWLEDWSDVARSVIKRRDQLIRLGLASRRPRGGGGAGGGELDEGAENEGEG
jgi:hypothetical protein